MSEVTQERLSEIDSMVDLFRRAWLSMPDKRMAQILERITGLDPYFMDDAKITSALQAYVDKKEGNYGGNQ